MLLTKKITTGWSALAVLLVVGLSASAFAEGPPTSAVQRQVADRLVDFKSVAYELRREADTLDSHRNKPLAWQTHSYHLENLRDQVNRLGKALTELEASMPMATEGQRMAIEHARPHLAAVAQSTTQAIELLRDNRNSIRFPEYGDIVSELYAHAEALHTKVDTIIDFENVRMRMDALELQSKSTEGS